MHRCLAASVTCALAIAFVPAAQAQVPPTRVADLDFEFGASEMINLFGVAIFWRDNSGVGGSRELWRSDGTESGTFMLATRTAANSPLRELGRLVRADRNVYFTSTDAATGGELWKTDGTVAGTRMVRDLLPNQTDTDPLDLTAVGRLLFFTARTVGLGEREVFVTDGSFEGTFMVKDIVPGFSGSNPYLLTAWKGKLYFVATGQLWESDGTQAGTVPVAPLSVPVVRMDAQTDHLYLSGRSSSRQRELWSSDGTTAGTQRLGAWTVDRDEQISPLVERDGEVFFSFDPKGGGAEVWSTDGTPAGTKLEVSSNDSFLSFYPLDNGIMFTRTDSATGREPWIFDRSTSTSSLLMDIVPGPGSSGAVPVLPVGDGLLFRVANGFLEMWFTDGTTASTVKISKSFYNFPFPVGSRQVWFEGSGKLWSTDGTVAGTVEEFAGGTWQRFVPVGSDLLFFHRDATSAAGRDLWKINPGAQARAVGHADADGLDQATMSATDPVLGGTSRWSVEDLPAGVPYAMVLGFPTAEPLFLPFSQFLDPLVYFVARSGFAPASGSVDLDVFVPDLPTLRNVELMLQTYWLGTRVRGTNGVMLVIGN